MKTPRSLLLAAALAAAPLAQAVSLDDPSMAGEPPVHCLLHFSTALPEATRFGADGSTTLAWEDSLGRRSETRINADGGLVLHLPDGRVQSYPPQPRVPSEAELAQLDRVVASYWEQGVDLVGRRLLSAQESEVRPAAEPDRVWDNAQGIWVLIDACEKAEREARDSCRWGCAAEGMSNIYRPGQCGAGAACTCVYEVSLQPDW